MDIKRFSALTIGVLVVIGMGLYLFLHSNSKSTVPQGSNQTSNNASTVLDYSGRGLTSFPQELLNRSDVTSLDISNNQLSGALPGEIRQMVSLEHLNVSNNRMTGIPAEIGQLKKLKVLNYNNNRITGLPLELGNLTQLQLLDLSGNNISQQDLAKIQQKLTSTQIKQ